MSTDKPKFNTGNHVTVKDIWGNYPNTEDPLNPDIYIVCSGKHNEDKYNVMRVWPADKWTGNILQVQESRMHHLTTRHSAFDPIEHSHIQPIKEKPKMQTKYQIDDLVLIKNEKSHYSTVGGVPIVYKVYQVIYTKDKPTEYVMDFVNSESQTKTKAFAENKLDPVPADHPLFTIFGTRPVSAKNENGDT